MSVENIIKRKQINRLKGNLLDENQSDDFGFRQIMTDSKKIVIKRIRERLVEEYKIDESNNSIQKFNAVRNQAWKMIDEETKKNGFDSYFDSIAKAEIFETIIQNMFGYGILDSLIHDPNITEIMVNGLDRIFVEKNGVIERLQNSRGEYLKFDCMDDLLFIIEKIVSPINRKVDESNPIVDARLPNGFRVNIVLNPISLDGHIITIRKFPENPYTMEQLVQFGMLPDYVSDFLQKLVEARYNVIISGGTGSGKTTFLNAMSNFIPGSSRIITIEDAAELKITGLENLIRLETRPANIEGKGEINMRELVRTALRMRPDRIIVGEVRGGEALDMLQAMNTGHDGSLSTGHSNSATDMLSRLETMVLMSGMELPLMSIRQQIASAVDLIVHIGKLQSGVRRVMQITEILGSDANGYIAQDIFSFKKNLQSDGKIGELIYTGNSMKQLDRFILSGIKPVSFINKV